MKTAIWIVCFLTTLLWSCAPSKNYSHYSNHKTETHHKPTGNSGKAHPSTLANATNKSTTNTNQKTTSGSTNTTQKSNSGSTNTTQKTTNTQKSETVAGQKMMGTIYKRRHISKDSLSRFKAVLISAPVDGPTGEYTKNFAAGLGKVADYLRSAGVHVSEFYCPNDDWAKIKAAAENANILIYSGHGVYDGKIPPSWVGGYSLTSGFVSSHQIQEDLKLAKNAIVLFNHACFTAGSAAGDPPNITQAEAHRRVGIYAHPFMDLGAACYYSNNFDDCLDEFFDGFFAGNYVNDIYITTAGSWSKILEIKPYEFRKDAAIGISKFGEDSYDVAFVGRKDFTILEWFTKK